MSTNEVYHLTKSKLNNMLTKNKFFCEILGKYRFILTSVSIVAK